MWLTLCMLVSIVIFPAIWIAKLLYFSSKHIKKGNGTSLPGLFIEKYIPWVLSYFNDKFDEIIYITGTNGKTTTRALLVHIFEMNGVSIVTNRGGANILRGIASSLMLNTNVWGNSNVKTLILEVEEATLPKLTKYIKPNKLIITNIFRDQLDAYGEIDSTLQFFRYGIAISEKDKNLEIIINADDHKLLSIIPENKPITTFSIENKSNRPQFEAYKGNKKYNIERLFVANHIKPYQEGVTRFEIDIQNQLFKTQTQLPGTYNIYNVLAAIAVGFPIFGDRVFEDIASFKPVFGRGEQIKVNKANIHLFLVKNPAGFDEVLEFIYQSNQNCPINIGFCINDNIADGKDVSWLWDIKLETFAQKQLLSQIFTSGTRGLDMLLRLEYAGCDVTIDDNYAQIDNAIEKIASQKGDFYVLCTYTALLSTRKILEKFSQLNSITDAGN